MSYFTSCLAVRLFPVSCYEKTQLNLLAQVQMGWEEMGRANIGGVHIFIGHFTNRHCDKAAIMLYN